MEFFKKTALAALVMGFSGAALALPNITILATEGTTFMVVTPQPNLTTQRVKLA